MSDDLAKPCTAFEGARRLSSGPLIEVVLAVKEATDRGASAPLLVFDDATGGVLDFDLRGAKADVITRLSGRAARPATPSRNPKAQAEAAPPEGPRGKGRPKLGVVAREVTLLPRHWDWLAGQPGGASAALRRLVDEARRTGSGNALKRRTAQEAAHRFMSAMAGNLAGFEEASRALFADDRPRMEQHMAGWPADIRDHVLRLAFDERSLTPVAANRSAPS